MTALTFDAPNYTLGTQNNSATEQATVVLHDSSYDSCTQWNVNPTTTGAYKLTNSLSDGSTELVLALSEDSDNDGVWLKQSAYSNDSNYIDEWELYLIKSASNVEVEGQQMSQWCWAATSRMFAKHYFNNVEYTQSEAVTHVKGSVKNDPGTVHEASAAMRFYISNITGASLDLYVNEFRIFAEDTLCEILEDNHVVYAAIGQYENAQSAVSTGIGHAILIFGYVVKNGDLLFLIRDPMPENKGTTYTLSYEALYMRSGDNSKVHVWRNAIVASDDYQDSLIPYHFDAIAA